MIVGGFGAGNGTVLHETFDGPEVCPPFAATTVVRARQQRELPAAGSGTTALFALPLTTWEPFTAPKVAPLLHSIVVEAISESASAEPSL